MTLMQLSKQYRLTAKLLHARMRQLEAASETAGEGEAFTLQARVRVLAAMHREAVELAVLTQRYYEKGYYRNGKYTL